MTLYHSASLNHSIWRRLSCLGLLLDIQEFSQFPTLLSFWLVPPLLLFVWLTKTSRDRALFSFFDDHSCRFFVTIYVDFIMAINICHFVHSGEGLTNFPPVLPCTAAKSLRLFRVPHFALAHCMLPEVDQS